MQPEIRGGAEKEDEDEEEEFADASERTAEEAEEAEGAEAVREDFAGAAECAAGEEFADAAERTAEEEAEDVEALQEAERLKAEGNTLYLAEETSKAEAKYIEALDTGEGGPGRAASGLGGCVGGWVGMCRRSRVYIHVSVLALVWNMQYLRVSNRWAR